jgi:hypothetical protein
MLGFLSLWVWPVIPALAQAGEPILHSSADYTFGQTMRFRLSAENVGDTETIALFFRAPELANTYSVNTPFERGERIELVYLVDLTQVRLAPFTKVTYWWLLTTDSGQAITVPEQTVAYDDSRFNWRIGSQNGHTVYWMPDVPDLGAKALQIAIEALPDLQAIIPVQEVPPLQIFIYREMASLRSALRLTGRDLVGDRVSPELGVILVTAVNAVTAEDELQKSIPREMAHLLLYQAAGANYVTMPTWFKEGLSGYVEQEPNRGHEALLQEAVAAADTIEFSRLCESFPADAERASLARAQSVSLVRFIQARYGNSGLGAMIEEYAVGAECESGVNRALQSTLDELERSWLRNQQPLPSAIQYTSENGLWLLLLIGGFLIARLLILNPTSYKREP